MCAEEQGLSTYELYCIARLPRSYQQRSVKRLQDDAALITADDARSARETAVKRVKARMGFGRDLFAEMSVRNAMRGLTMAQRRSLRQSVSDVKDALETGSLEDAKDGIQNLTVDGTIIVQADVDWAVGKIDAYIAAE